MEVANPMIPLLLHSSKARTANFFLYPFVYDVRVLTNKPGKHIRPSFVMIALNPAFFSIGVTIKCSGARYLFI